MSSTRPEAAISRMTWIPRAAAPSSPYRSDTASTFPLLSTSLALQPPSGSLTTSKRPAISRHPHSHALPAWAKERRQDPLPALGAGARRSPDPAGPVRSRISHRPIPCRPSWRSGTAPDGCVAVRGRVRAAIDRNAGVQRQAVLKGEGQLIQESGSADLRRKSCENLPERFRSQAA